MANLKDLVVYGKARAVGGFLGDLTGTADKATADANGDVISTTYLKSATASSTYSTKAETVTAVVAGSTADKINVTKNGSTSTITVNNVANATSATLVVLIMI